VNETGRLPNSMTPLERTEALYKELIGWYGNGSDKELRAASKLLMVALDRLRAHAGDDWQSLVRSYMVILAEDPERFRKMLDSQRGESKTDPEEKSPKGTAADASDL